MQERQITLGKLVTIGLWTGVVALIGAGWLAHLGANDTLAQMLGLTACATSAAAAACQVRCYVMRLARLVRATAGLRSEPEPLQSVR